MTTPEPPESDVEAVARVLLSDAVCVQCLQDKTGQNLDTILDAIAGLEATLKVSRTWAVCRFCHRSRILLWLRDEDHLR